MPSEFFDEKRKYRNPSKRLKRIYILALTFIALILIFSQIIIRTSIGNLSEDASIVMNVGQQKMLTQQIITKIALYNYKKIDQKEELEDLLNHWKKIHLILQNGEFSLKRIDWNNAIDTEEFFEDLNVHYENIKNEAEKTINGQYPKDSVQVVKNINNLIQHKEEYLEAMNFLIKQFEVDSKDKLKNLGNLELVLFILSLSILLIEALVIFIPSIKSIERFYTSLEQAKKILTAQHGEIKKQKETLDAKQKSLMIIEKELTLNVKELQTVNETLEAKNQDLDESYKLLDEQKKEIALLSQIAEEVNNGIIVTGGDGKVEWVNKGFTQISGFSPKNIIGKETGDVLYSEETSKETIAHINKFLKEKIPFNVEVLSYHRLGLPYWNNLQITPLLDSNNNVEKYIYVQQDITEQKNIEERIRKQNQDLINFQAELSESYAFQEALFNSASVIIIATDNNGIVTNFNRTAERLLGYDSHEIIHTETPTLFFNCKAKVAIDPHEEIDESNYCFSDLTKKLNDDQNTIDQEHYFMRKDGSHFPVYLSITRIKNEEQDILGYIVTASDVSEKKKAENQLKESFETIQEKNKKITASINYAQRIQKAILPTEQQLKSLFADYFVFYSPKDIVSGDFYWATTKDDKIIVAAVDCTGHGVPGAFMSLIGSTLLSKIVGEYNITEPHEILEQLHIEVNHTLRQKSEGGTDGMDMSLCTIYPDDKRIEFSGARNPIFALVDGKFEVYKGNKKCIGGNLRNLDQYFTKEIITYQNEATIYMFSDGYQDQFGGPETPMKLGQKNMRASIQENVQLSMADQKAILAQNFYDWKKDENQMDDILLFGIKLT
ncbi:PAS domain S-box protein [Chondrinema litorale]|uniref:PAS domain S-box protein n=1 Tax=Chondrinema litorale TaxID=2994555 RepID=UPI002543E637|nr:PAS domain S-box protein [Chondrinema litorale]UZR97617.1 PAS domain S-box protein [Chondrinema litorale]